MRLNKFIALATGLSRRAADAAIQAGRITVNGRPPELGQQIKSSDQVVLDKNVITLPVNTLTVMLNKPVGYVCSRDGQGNRTIYDLLPPQYHRLKPVGRLDKDSSGLLLLTDDGDLAHRFTHPSFQKTKVYEVTLDKPLRPIDRRMITEDGVQLDDGMSKFQISRQHDEGRQDWTVVMSEGRNRQIRRTFKAAGYEVTALHRTAFGPHSLDGLELGKFKIIEPATMQP